MPELSPPTVAVKDSFLAAMAEFRAEGRGAPGEHSMIAGEMRQYGDTWHTDEGFATYVAELRAQALEETPRPAHFVPCTTFWWVEGPEYLGRIAVRHRLNEHLLEEGGHVGYDVRASARRRGHATAMLRAVLPYAASLGHREGAADLRRRQRALAQGHRGVRRRARGRAERRPALLGADDLSCDCLEGPARRPGGSRAAPAASSTRQRAAPVQAQSTQRLSRSTPRAAARVIASPSAHDEVEHEQHRGDDAEAEERQPAPSRTRCRRRRSRS